jgi:hypothetical protein
MYTIIGVFAVPTAPAPTGAHVVVPGHYATVQARIHALAAPPVCVGRCSSHPVLEESRYYFNEETDRPGRTMRCAVVTAGLSLVARIKGEQGY